MRCYPFLLCLMVAGCGRVQSQEETSPATSEGGPSPVAESAALRTFVLRDVRITFDDYSISRMSFDFSVSDRTLSGPVDDMPPPPMYGYDGNGCEPNRESVYLENLATAPPLAVVDSGYIGTVRLDSQSLRLSKPEDDPSLCFADHSKERGWR